MGKGVRGFILDRWGKENKEPEDPHSSTREKGICSRGRERWGRRGGREKGVEGCTGFMVRRQI